jgi:hypothetical protein
LHFMDTDWCQEKVLKEKFLWRGVLGFRSDEASRMLQPSPDQSPKYETPPRIPATRAIREPRLTSSSPLKIPPLRINPSLQDVQH